MQLSLALFFYSLVVPEHTSNAALSLEKLPYSKIRSFLSLVKVTKMERSITPFFLDSYSLLFALESALRAARGLFLSALVRSVIVTP